MARTNVPLVTPKIYTHEGAVAKKIDAVSQLRRTVMACLLHEDNFYEDGVSVFKRMTDEVNDVLKLKNGADIVANIAVEARSKFKLRHAPLALINVLVRARTKAANDVVSGALFHAIQRPDEINEFVSQYWSDGKKPLPNQVKKGLAAAFTKFDEYSLGKYANRDAAVKLRDVLFLTHAKPQNSEQAELWKKLADNTLKAPLQTWEVRLSAGEDKKTVFTELLSENSLKALALLRNLRNMQQSGVDVKLIREALKNINTERVLPFRFITAARYAPTLEPELETAMFKCLEGSEKLKGKTVLVVDNSGSMSWALSSKSELTRQDAASALAILLREICEEVQIVVFGGTAGVIRPRRGFALRDEIRNSGHGGSTNTQIALNVAKAEGYDRIIVLTDEQSHQTITPPVKGTKAYFINVASEKNGIGYKEWTHFDGFSESVITYILAAESMVAEEELALV
jgi:60 kDa SS-A/Ro ribonucleoprotein